MNYLRLLLIGIVFLFSISIICAPPPTPHGVDGYIFESDGSTQVALGTSVNLTNINSFDSIKTSTSGPAPDTGAYSTTIRGNNDDLIVAYAWNATHFGNNTVLLFKQTTQVNVTINYTRPAEPNITIVSPADNSAYNNSGYFSVTANITMSGSYGSDCNATIGFIGTTVLLSDSETQTHDLGTIGYGTTVSSFWNLTGENEGSSNVTINVTCANIGMKFDDTQLEDTLYNITMSDNASPEILDLYPENNTESASATSFYFNVSDGSAIANCSLLLEGVVNLTNFSVNKDVTQVFSQVFDIGQYNWSIQCFDNSSNRYKTVTGVYNLTILFNRGPNVEEVFLPSSIDLVAGVTKTVLCNATIYDADGAIDISLVNATFFDYSESSDFQVDNNNNHYSNISCEKISSSQYQANYSCSFSVWYYANNQSWVCNVTAYDASNLNSSNTTRSTINELFAMNISEVINYGVLVPGAISSTDTNITITNEGNKVFNLSVLGYAVSEGDDLSLDCDVGNITVSNAHYSASYGLSYSGMESLSSSFVQIPDMQIAKRVGDISQNDTYWKIRAPFGRKGICTGYVIFSITT